MWCSQILDATGLWWAGSTVGRVVKIPLSVLALAGLVVAPGVMLMPLGIAAGASAGKAWVIAAGVLSLVGLVVLVGLSLRAILAIRVSTGAISLDHVLLTLGAMLWATAVPFMVV